MQLTASQDLRLEQKLSPRMIQFYEMLQCPLQDLDLIIARELSENPALELIEVEGGASLSESAEPDYVSPTTLALSDHVWQGDERVPWATSAEDLDDPIAALPAPMSLHDHLRWHFMALAKTAEEQRIGERIIADINGDGYFEGTIGEVAMALEANIVEVERVLELVQRLDPAGVGARDLQECLQIQLRQLDEGGRCHTVAKRLVEECWEPFARRQFPVCARRLKVSEAAVSDAAEFLRKQCHPYPGVQFRPAWQSGASSPQARPELRVRRNQPQDPHFVVEVLESRSLSLRVDRVYRRLEEAIRLGAPTADDEAEHVQSCVRRARQFIKTLRQRRETLRRIAQAVVDRQEDYLEVGPASLKPLTRQEIARQLDLHESTVGRAVADKHVQLPDDDVVMFETFFDSSKPLRMALETLLQQEDKRRPLSDQALAEALQAQGFDVARRTVTKYRQILKVPSTSQRKLR